MFKMGRLGCQMRTAKSHAVRKPATHSEPLRASRCYERPPHHIPAHWIRSIQQRAGSINSAGQFAIALDAGGHHHAARLPADRPHLGPLLQK